MLGECGIDADLVHDPEDLGATLDDGSYSAIIVGEPEHAQKTDLIRKARQHPLSARIAVIAIVGAIDGPESTSLIEAGADDVFALPITAEDLGQTIRRSRWENTRELEAAARELRLVKPANLLLEVFNQARDGYFVSSESGGIIAASAGLERLSGFSRDELMGETMSGLGLTVTPEFEAEAQPNEPQRLSFTLVTSDWRKVPVCAEVYEIRLAGIRCHFGIIREEAATESVAPQHARSVIQTVVRNSTDPILLVDPSGTFQHISKGFEQVLGWNPDALQGRTLMDFVAPEDYHVVQPFSTGEAIQGGVIEGIQLLQENGEYRTVNLTITALEQNPLMNGWLIVISAPANSVLHQTKRLAGGGYYSLYDPVTALPNRLLFIDRLDHAIERSGRVHSVMCCIVVSIDDVEERLIGLPTEDLNQIFCEFGRRLHQSMREGDTIARVGDTDFAILAEGVGGAAEARMLGERIISAIRDPFVTATGTLNLRPSIGSAISKPSGQNAGNLLRDATAAMEYSRKTGGGRNTIFEDSMRQSVVDSLRIEDELKGLHERGELQIFFQPEVDIQNETILAAEALVRWEHPRHGLILPGEFLSLADESGLLNEIGLWIIETVCQTVQGWRKRHANASNLAGVVNLTPGQIENEGFVDSVAEILDRTGLPARNLRLEISESEQQHFERWREVAGRLRDLGVKIGLQDANPAVLTADMLETLPIDTIKIDRTAMNTPVQNPSRPSQSVPMAQFAPKHHFDVVVAGIETAQHLARARIYGYQYGQGFYFYRPVPSQTVEYLLIRGLKRLQQPQSVEPIKLAATA